jgi:hypothetical protein
MGGMGGYVGLNYQSADFLIKLYEIDKPKEVFDDLRIIERAALKAMNEDLLREKK